MNDHPAETPTHPCVAEGCTTQVAARFAMCAAHWRKVPWKVRHRIHDAYTPGQTAQTASLEYLHAVAAAVAELKANSRQLWRSCAIGGCTRRVPARVVVCRDCWRALPDTLQTAVAGLRTAPGHHPGPDHVADVLHAATTAVHAAKGST